MHPIRVLIFFNKSCNNYLGFRKSRNRLHEVEYFYIIMSGEHGDFHENYDGLKRKSYGPHKMKACTHPIHPWPTLNCFRIWSPHGIVQ